jgi:hypothetical protein
MSLIRSSCCSKADRAETLSANTLRANSQKLIFSHEYHWQHSTHSWRARCDHCRPGTSPIHCTQLNLTVVRRWNRFLQPVPTPLGALSGTQTCSSIAGQSTSNEPPTRLTNLRFGILITGPVESGLLSCVTCTNATAMLSA